MKISRLTLSCLLLLGGGCSLIPEYQRPALPVPDEYVEPLPSGPGADFQAAWNSFFVDAELQRLIRIALENNRDLRVAALNVEAYRALYKIERSNLMPDVSVDATINRRRIPGGSSSSGGGSGSAGSASGTSNNVSSASPGVSDAYIASWYSNTLSLSWELDFFGRLDSLREQALDQFLATEAARRSTQVALVADVANAWLRLKADHGLLQLTEETLKAYEDTLSLSQLSFDVGVSSAMEVRQAQTSVDTARAAMERYTRAVQQDRHALALLLGQPLPDDLALDWDPEQQMLAKFRPGLPSELLLQRPDIIEAEYQLQAANANIGAARAAFFPSINLTAAAGTASGQASDLFDGGSGYWAFMPIISVPLAIRGQLQGELDYATLSKDIRVAQYEKAIQTAFREVTDGLSARSTYRRQVAAQTSLVEATADYYHLAHLRYQTGIDDYLTLLDAQRQLFTAQQQLITDQLEQRIAEVNLYKAMGGGWLDEKAETESNEVSMEAIRTEVE